MLPEGGGGAREGRARRSGPPRFPADPLEAPARQQRAGEGKPGDKTQVARRAGVPLHGLAGAVMCEQGEIWQETRYFSGARMNELYDDGCTRGIDGPVEWARLEVEARKMLESGLELADRVEAAWDISRAPGFRAPGRLASDRALHQLSRHYLARARCHVVLLPLKNRRHHVSQIINRKTVYN